MSLTRRLSRVDLNLLVALQVLLQEKNVTRAAEQLHITQPAMSKTLQRLREVLNDPLFTRTAHGLVPTPKALQVQEPLAGLLEQLDATLFSEEFDPLTARGTLHIATPEAVATALFARLVERFTTMAPYLQLKTYNVMHDYQEGLVNGFLDFAIYLENHETEGFLSTPLPATRIKVWVNCDHPLAQKSSMSVSEFCHYPHISLLLPHFNDRGNSPIDAKLQSMGLQRRVLLQTSQLMLALEALKTTPAILVSADYIAQYGLTQGQLVHVPIEDDEQVFQPELPLYLVQHHRTRNSLLHRWMASQIEEVFDEDERFRVGSESA